MTAWDWLTVICKFFVLAAIAITTGGAFSLHLAGYINAYAQRTVLAYILGGAVCGLFATAAFFLVQVGGINQDGFPGVLDLQMIAIIASTGLGAATAIRMLGFLLVVGMIVIYRTQGSSSSTWPGRVFGFSAAAVLAVSFPFTGHTASLGVVAKLAVGLHVLAVFVWTGSLYPLWLFCRLTPSTPEGLKLLMQLFGRVATYIIAMLIITGIYLLTSLLDAFSELTDTAYGKSVLYKLLAVAVLLTLGAVNKFLLVPKIPKGNSEINLKHSISAEIILATLIIAITAWLSTLIG